MKWRSSLIYAVELNVTELCNFKCAFCPRAFDYPNMNYHMSRDIIDLIVEQLEDIPNINKVWLAGRGEPTLHKDFEYLIEKLYEFKINHRPNLKINLNTNGKNLAKYDHVARLITRVEYSIYDETKLTREEIAEQFGHLNLLIHDRRVDTIRKEPENVKYHNRAGSAPIDITYVPMERLLRSEFGLMCEKPFSIIYVNWNGDYNLCCNDWEDIQVLGNIKTESMFEYITENKRLLEYQKDLFERKRSLNPCNSCNRPFKKKWGKDPRVAEVLSKLTFDS